jgi:1,4-dihydroxy-2-naphthoyl-CoA synthase
MALDSWKTVQVTLDNGIAWVELNRPEKRNAMSPELNGEMIEVLTALDAEDACVVVVLTGAGEARHGRCRRGPAAPGRVHRVARPLTGG